MCDVVCHVTFTGLLLGHIPHITRSSFLSPPEDQPNMNTENSSPLSISQKDLTFGRRLSMKLEVVRRSCTELLDAPEAAGEKERQPCSSNSDPSFSKRDYLRRSTMMTAAASFADSIDHSINNSKSSFHSPSGSDFYPNSSDRKLIHENITATRQIMDLKLQVADLLSANDTLAHEKRLLTDAKRHLEVDCADIKSDLDKAYECIGRLKKERDEAVRDLTRARMLQIREDSRKTMLLGNGTASNTMTTDSVSSNSSNKSNTSGWFRRRNQPVDSSSPSSTKDKISSTASNAIAALNESRSVFNFLAANDGTDSTICSEEQDKRMVTCMPGRRTSSGDPPRAEPLGRRHTDHLLAEMQDWGTTQAPVLIRTPKVAEPTDSNNCKSKEKECRPRIERKDTESDVRAFLRDSFYDDDDDDDDDDSVVKSETFARNQSTLPFDDYQPQTKIGSGSNKNATWDDGVLERLPKRRSLNACEA